MPSFHACSASRRRLSTVLPDSRHRRHGAARDFSLTKSGGSNHTAKRVLPDQLRIAALLRSRRGRRDGPPGGLGDCETLVHSLHSRSNTQSSDATRVSTPTVLLIDISNPFHEYASASSDALGRVSGCDCRPHSGTLKRMARPGERSSFLVVPQKAPPGLRAFAPQAAAGEIITISSRLNSVLGID